MVKRSVSEERTVSLPQRHRLLFSTSHPNSLPMTDSPVEPNELVQDRHIFDAMVLMWFDTLLLCNQLTCCLLLCRPVDPPAPASPGAAVWGWNGSSFGLSDPVGLCQSAHQNLPGSDPAPRPLGWFETLGESCWPWRGEQKSWIGKHTW